MTFDGSAETDGSFSITGGTGNDTVTLGARSYADSFNGGSGTNTLVLNANPSDGVTGDDTIGAVNYQNIDKIVLASGAYEFDITGDISGTHKAFTVDATALAAINQGISASITISGTPDAVTYLGGAGSDLVAYSADAPGSAGATIDTNGGDDEIALTDVNSAALINVDGGAGNNTVFLQDTNGDTSLVTLAAAHYTNIQNVEVGDTQPLAITGDITGGSGALQVREDVGGSVDLSGATTAALSFQGSTGNDTLVLGANAANVTNATGNNTSGTPSDTIELVGGVSNFTLSSAHFSQFTNIVLADGGSYTGDAITGNISAHNKITIDASALTGSNAASLDLSGANISNIVFTGGAGDDSITLASAAASSAKINGGAGSDTIHSAGAFSLNSNASNIERVVYTNSGSSGSVTISGDITSGGGMLTIDASGVSTAVTTNFITLTGATTAAFNITGGAGNDLISLNTFNANDKIVGGGGFNEIALASNQAGFAITSANFTNVSEIDVKGTTDVSGFSVVGDLTQGSGSAGTFTFFADQQSGKLAVDLSGVTTTNIQFDGATGADTVTFGTGNFANAKLSGEGGDDTAIIQGNGTDYTYASAINFQKLSQIDNLDLAGANNFTLSFGSGLAATLRTFTVDASGITGGKHATLDFSGVDNTSTINVTGSAGDDVVIFGNELGQLASFNGGDGNDTLEIAGVKPTLNATNVSSVETVALLNTTSSLTTGVSMVGDITSGGGVLHFDTTAMSAGHTAIVTTVAATTAVIDLTGGVTNDVLSYGTFNAADQFVGGGGSNEVIFSTGQAGFAMSSANFSNVNVIALGSGITGMSVVGDLTQGTSSAGDLSVVASGGTGVSIDFTATTTAAVDFTGNDGNDTVIFSADEDNWGHVDGGKGNNTLELTGGGSATLSGSSIHDFDALTLTNGHYSQVTVTGDITTGAPSLTIDASATTGANIDLSAAATSLINVTGGTGDDYVIFNAFNAAATFVGGDGYNEIAYQSPQSGLTFTSAHYANVDEIDFNGTGNYTNVSVVGDLTAGGDNAGDFDVYAGGLAGAIEVDLSAVTTSEIDFEGSDGDDTVTLSTANFNGTFLNGQNGNDTVIIEGDGTDFTSHTLTNSNARNIANFDLTGDNNFALKFAAGIGEATGSVSVDASALTAGHSASVDFSHATTNAINFTGGAGDDTVIFSADSLAHASAVSGGDGNNTFALTGDGQDVNMTFDGNTFASFSTLAFEDGNNYDVTVASPFTGAASTLTVDASALSASYGATVDVTAIDETVNFTGGAGDDTVIFSSDNDNWGTVNGGAGNNTFEFNDGTAAIVSGASVTNFSTLSFADGHDYSGIHVTGDITGNNGTLNVDASAVSSGHTVDVDLSGVTSSGIAFTGGAGDDTVVFGANLANVISADGGAGNNVLALTGGGHDVTATFSGANLANFSDLALEDGNNYDITVTGGFGGEAGLNIDASALTSTHGATIDVSGLPSFSVDFTGGAGNDTILAGADLGNMTIDGGGGNDVLKLDGDYSAGFTLSSITNITEVDLAGGNAYSLTTTDATVAAGATLTVDASALGPNFGLTFDGSAETDGYFDIKGGSGDDSLTLQTMEVDNSTIDGGAGFNTVTLTGNHTGVESFNAASFSHIDNIDYAAGSFGGEISFTGDITGDGSTLSVGETNADGFGGSGPDGDMLFTDISALTDTIDLTGAVVDDYVVVSSVNWTSLNGNGGNYNALIDIGTDPITFDAATITGFNTLVFNFDLNGNAADFSGIGVVGDLTGDGGTLTIDARFSNSISIDLSQATSDIAFDGSTGDDTISFGNAFSASDTVAGGGGSDTLSLGRNNAALTDTAITGVSTVTLSGGSAFAVTGDITSGGGQLTVDASAISDPRDVANIDFSQATTEVIDFTGGAGNDRVTFSASEANWGAVDGGAGANNFILNSGGTASIDGASVTDFSTIILRNGGSYTLTLSGDIAGGGQTLTVGANALSDGNTVSVDASASSNKISFTGGDGDDTFTGSSHGDTIALGAGGIDTVHGGAGDDTITVKALTVGGDFIDGGAGANTMSISGVGEADLNGATITNIQTLNLSANDAVITGDITGGQPLTINVTALSGATIDLTQATTSGITINGSASSDTLLVSTDSVTDVMAYSGGGGSDTLALSDASDSGDWNVGSSVFQGLSTIVLNNAGALTISGDVTGAGGTLNIDASALSSGDIADVDFSAATSLVNITGGAGGDTFTAGNSLVAGDTINGGGGDDQVALSGNYLDLTLTATTLTNIADLQLESGSFDITTDDGTVAAGQVLTVSAEFLGAGNTLTFNGAAETDGSFDFQVLSSSIANGDVTLTGGAGDDTLDVDSSFSTITLDGTHFQSIETVDFFTGTLTIAGNITASPIGTLTVSSVGGSGFSTTVDVSQATTPTIDFAGGDGDDTLIFGSNLGNVGTADGGGGTNTLELTGNGTDVAAGFIGANFTNFTPTITFEDGNNYHLFVVSGFAGSDVLTLDASQLSASYGAIVNVSRSAMSDVDFTGGAGNDTIVFGNGFSQVGSVDGGGGTNTVGLAGSTTGANIVANFDGSEFANFSGLQLEEGDYYGITIINGFTGNDVINIDASQLTSGYRTSIDVSQVSLTVNFAGGTDDDTLIFGANIGNAGTVDGGGGTNTLELTGGGSDVTTDFAGANFTNFQSLVLEDGNNYDITATSGFNGGGLSVDASRLAHAYHASIDASQISQTVHFIGGAGDDTIIVAGDSAASDTIDGGANDALDQNILGLAGGTSSAVTLTGYTGDDSVTPQISNVQKLVLVDGASYSLVIDGKFAESSDSFHLDASALTGSNAVTLDLTNANVGGIFVTTGAGDDTITVGSVGGDISTGAGDDTLISNGFVGSIEGGQGNDTLVLMANSGASTINDSSVSGIDNIVLGVDQAYSLTVSGDIGNSGTLHIDASLLSSASALDLDISSATTAAIAVTGGAGDDVVTVGGNLADVTIDGGAGDNTVTLDGDYSAGITLSMISNVGEVDLTAGNSYNITLAASNASSGDFYLAGDALGVGDSLTVDSTAVTSGEVDIHGGAGNDTITTGVTSGNTYLDLSQGGEDTVHGGSANDSVYMGDALDTADRIDGGGGFNTVYLEGDSYAGGLDLGAGELANVNYVKLFGDHTYVLAGDPATLNSSDYVTIDGGAMTGGSLQFDGSAVTDGAFSLYGGAGDDILKGGSGNDTLDLSVGGEDQLAGNGGNDIINAGGGLDAGDQVVGGAGTDTLNFNGDYSAGLVLGATTVTNVETFSFAAGHSYNITTNDATVSGTAVADTLVPGTLTVDGSKLGASDVLVFDGSAEQESAFVITGGAGNDVLTGGAGNDIFHLAHGGDDTIQGGAGNDTIFGETGYSSGDMIDGGTGSNIFWLGGKDYTGASAVTFTAANFLTIQTIELNSRHNYSLTMNDANVTAGATMVVDGHLANSFTFDGSAETDGHFKIVASTGADVLAGGALSDTFVFNAVNYSTGTTYDAITNLNFSSDSLQLGSAAGVFLPTGVDAAITSGALSTATFNTDLATAVSSSKLAADHAVLFTADSGTLSGHTFLVVDHNGTAGYQSGSDYVIDVTGYSGTLTTGSFT